MEPIESRILRALGASEMTSRRLAYLVGCDIGSVQALVRRKQLVVVGRVPGWCRQVKGVPVVRAA